MVHFYISADRISNGRGNLLHCSKYAFEFKNLENLHFLQILPPQIVNFTTPVPCISPALLPHVVKGFVLRTDDYALALYISYYSVRLGYFGGGGRVVKDVGL